MKTYRESIEIRAAFQHLKRPETLATAIIGPFAAFVFATTSTAAQAKSLTVVSPVSATACGDLLATDFTVAADGTKLKSDDAPFRVDTVAEVPASAVPPIVPLPYCRVTGTISQAIRFEVHLPTTGWTQRYLQFSCGGYCGANPVSVSTSSQQAAGCESLLSGEMVTAAHDAGHQRNGTGSGTVNTPGVNADGMWAMNNPDAVVNFAYASNHKVAVAAKRLISAFYGQGPAYSYISGCSDGGRQGLQEAQRYPTDFNGVLAGSTTLDVTTTNTFLHGWNIRTNQGALIPGFDPPRFEPILTADKLPALNQAVLKKCANFIVGDGNDLIRDARGCNFDARDLICPGPDMPTCLTAAQADVVNKIWQGPIDQQGDHLSPADWPRGSELGWIGSMVPNSNATPPNTQINMLLGDYQFSWDFPQYMASFKTPTGIDNRNMQFTRQDFNILMELQQLFDPNSPDLRAFAAARGKLIMFHGWIDNGSSPRGTLNYYNAVRQLIGANATSQFLTVYMVPGMYHCNGSPPAPYRRFTNEDFLTQLINWVEDGTSPGRVTINYGVNPNNTTDPTVWAFRRPVFPYPAIAAYQGSGDVNLPDNYVATSPPQHFSDRFDWLGLANYKPNNQLWCQFDGSRNELGLQCEKIGGGE
jgi:hypothetical protein